jgi:hypothetical protein
LTESNPEPPPRKPWTFGGHKELLAALASGFVGALALATSTYNVYLQRQQVRAQVWPYLVLGADFDGKEGVSITVTNRGVGPAQVKRVRVSVDGKRAGDWQEAIAMLLHSKSPPLGESWRLGEIEDQVMSPGQDIIAMAIKQHSRELVAERRRLAIEICYCSTLDECWLLSSPNPFDPPTTQPIAECVRDAKPFHSTGDVFLDTVAAGVSHPESPGEDGGPSDP